MSEIERAPAPIVRRTHDGQVMADSRDVADYFGKNHKDVLRAIDALISEVQELQRNFAPMFVDVQIGNGATRRDRAFEIDRDGFTLLAMGFTGPSLPLAE